jgi:Secretion system C-terminal sorting domain
LVFSGYKLLCQTSLVQLLNEVAVQNAAFTTSESQIWNHFIQETPAANIRLVAVSDIHALLSGNALTIIVPGTTDTLLVKGMYHQNEGATNYTWWGEVEGGLGAVGIASNEMGKLLHILYPGKSYVYYPLSSRYNAQVELQPNPLLEDEPEIETPPDVTFTVCEAGFCKAVLTVLVLVTEEAVDEILSNYEDLSPIQKSLLVKLHIGLGELTLNIALLNSGLVGKSARFVTEEFAGFEFGLDHQIDEDLTTLLDYTPDAWDRWHANRADLLVLLTDSRYGTITGLADVVAPAAIVSVGYMGAPRYNFVHEIGHLLGARHNRVSNQGNEPDDAGCNFGYRFQFLGGTGYTVMARMADPGAYRILNFSDPRIELLGSKIGADGSNNAGYLSVSFCPVANKFYDDDELEVDINGPTQILCGGAGTFTAMITPPASGIPGQPPFTYTWIRGEVPFVYPNAPGNVFLGNSPSLTIDASSLPTGNYWLFLNIWSSDGVMTSDVVNFSNVPCSPGFTSSTSDEQLGDYGQKDLIISPNPAHDLLTISLIKPESYLAGNFNVTNALGQVLLTGTFQPESMDLPINLPSGIYYLQFSTKRGNQSQKFVVQH